MKITVFDRDFLLYIHVVKNWGGIFGENVNCK